MLELFFDEQQCLHLPSASVQRLSAGCQIQSVSSGFDLCIGTIDTKPGHLTVTISCTQSLLLTLVHQEIVPVTAGLMLTVRCCDVFDIRQRNTPPYQLWDL